MRLNQWSAKIVLVGLFAFGAASAFAANSNCGLLQSCASQAAPAPVKKSVQQTSKPVSVANDTLTYYLENLELTPEQIVMLRNVQESQVPQILLSKRHLEAAHAKLREMAIRNAYDQNLADQLAQVIASQTANLAVLQAQREYELFSALSAEQVARYEALTSQVQ